MQPTAAAAARRGRARQSVSPVSDDPRRSRAVGPRSRFPVRFLQPPFPSPAPAAQAGLRPRLPPSLPPSCPSCRHLVPLVVVPFSAWLRFWGARQHTCIATSGMAWLRSAALLPPPRITAAGSQKHFSPRRKVENVYVLLEAAIRHVDSYSAFPVALLSLSPSIRLASQSSPAPAGGAI